MSDAPDAPAPTDARPSLVGWAATAAVMVVSLYSALMSDFFPLYHPFSDDAGVILNSSAPYFSISHWAEWFTHGWAGYAVNYPDWGPFGNNTLKPVVNLVFAMEGALTPQVGNGAFLIMSYAAPAVTAFALVFAFRRLAKTTPAMSLTLALCVATSAFWIGSLVNAVDMTNTLALMFSAIVLALLPVDGQPSSALSQSGLVVLQLLAIFSHETALVLPFVCVALMYALSEARPKAQDLWPYVAAPVVWLFVRLFVLQARSGVYALTLQGVFRVKVWGYWLLNVLIPVDARGMWMARGLTPMVHPSARIPLLVSVVVVIAVNAAFLLAVAVRVLRRRQPRTLLLALAFVLATAPHLTTAFDSAGARFAGLSMVVGLMVCVLLFEDQKRALVVIAGILLAAQVLFAFTGLVERKAEATAACRGAQKYSAYVHEAVNRYSPDRVVVVNDVYGQYGVPALVRLEAWPRRGFDVVVINNLVQGDRLAGRVSVRRSGDELSIDSMVGEDSSIAFFGAERVDLRIKNQGFKYALLSGTLAAPREIIATGTIGTGKTLVVGFDPADGSLIEPILYR